jgi:hypothetical protein
MNMLDARISRIMQFRGIKEKPLTPKQIKERNKMFWEAWHRRRADMQFINIRQCLKLNPRFLT